MRYPLTLYRVGGCFLTVHSPGLHPVTAQTQRLQVKSICHPKKEKAFEISRKGLDDCIYSWRDITNRKANYRNSQRPLIIAGVSLLPYLTLKCEKMQGESFTIDVFFYGAYLHCYFLCEINKQLGVVGYGNVEKEEMNMKQELPRFNLDEIPDSGRMQLVAIVHEEAKKYFQQPGVQEKYEKWLEQREAKKADTKKDE